jgi:hypothetical protein
MVEELCSLDISASAPVGVVAGGNLNVKPG